MFGIVTKTQLEQHAKELREEVRRCETMMEEWYDKFRRLYARLSKRVADAEQVDEGGTPGEEQPPIVEREGTTGQISPANSPVAFNRRRMRGF